jgi:hypothetical protein
MSGSYNETAMRRMGERNAGWGICGITSTFYAMYQTNPGARSTLINAPKPYSVLAEIKTFLMTLRDDGKTAMLKDTETFTRSFGVVDGTDFSGFTIDGYIKYINDSLRQYVNKDTLEVDEAIESDAKFGIGLPPEVVAEYARRIWGYNATAAMNDQSGDAIVGVKDTSRWFNGFRLYGGLVHYVYRKNGQYYTWGQDPYATLTAADPNFQLCCTVKLSAK